MNPYCIERCHPLRLWFAHDSIWLHENQIAVQRAVLPADWSARRNIWRQKIIDEGWGRDPDLSLASLSRKLGINTTELSRAINEGLGLNFYGLINRLRVDAVKAALLGADSSQGLLDIAFAAGFSSKASFNRSFRLYTGEIPTTFRVHGERTDGRIKLTFASQIVNTQSDEEFCDA